MRVFKNWSRVAGRILHVLVGGLMIFAGSAKLLGFFPPEALNKLGLAGQIGLIGTGEIVAAILLLIPRTPRLAY